jgi:RNA polymerase sigma factor (TIGR02999 family)
MATSEVSELVRAWVDGDRQALDRLMPHIHGELRRLAAVHLRRERGDHTLEPTALVHEAYLRILGREQLHLASRAEFFALAAQAMRRVLVDHARRRAALRRGGDLREVTVVGLDVFGVAQDSHLVELDEALTRLAALDPRQAKVVELRFFGGLEIEEIATTLDISVSTVQREWRMAKAWLRRELQPT